MMRWRFFTRGTIDRAFALAENEAHFRVDDASPERAARRITIPVLLIHGADDVDTPPAHSQRVRAALIGRRTSSWSRAHDNESLNGAGVWSRIEAWLVARQ
jgi:dipeptidyl aminopeptidase/acylaminoacyl peptidase